VHPLIIGVDNSAARLKHFNALKEKLQLRNVRCHLVDWNLYDPQDNRWDFMSAEGTTLVICNNFNFDNDRTQENMERLLSGRCNEGTLILSYSTAFAARGDITGIVWRKEITFPRDHFSWAAVDKSVMALLNRIKDHTLLKT
jgi:hypothetical protein